MIYTADYNVYGYDTDLNCVVTLPRLLCMMHETAWKHVNSLHIGWQDLHKINQFWAISKIKLQITRLPSWNDQISIHTWGKEKKLIIYPRDYEIIDSQGNIIVSATSDWVLIDSISNHPVRDNAVVDKQLCPNSKCAINEHLGKLSIIPFPEDSPVHQTLISDLDMNNHVNNTSYVKWILDDYSIDFFQNHSIKSLCINYISQLRIGESYYLAKKEIAPFKHLYNIFNAQKEIVTKIELIWEKK